MGLSSKRKGAHYESEALKKLQELGIKARKTAGSGAVAGYNGDIEADLYGGFNIEVKYSACDRGMAIARRYLKPVDCLMSRSPGEEWLVSLHAEGAFKLLRDANTLAKVRAKHPQLVTEAELT